MDGAYDMGGMATFGAVDPADNAVFHARWEERAFGISMIAMFEGLASGGDLRETMYTMHPAAYLTTPYYGRWLHAIERLMVASGTITSAELDGWVERLRAGEAVPTASDSALAERTVAAFDERLVRPLPATARFAVGDAVRVRRIWPRDENHAPRYLRGAAGVIERVQCEDPRPGSGGQPVEPVYAVRFGSIDVFGEQDEPPFTILADLWESYLEADA
jgi:nitrile hydratase subunit beta